MAEIIKPDMTELWASGGAKITPSQAKIVTGWTAEIPPHQWENWVQGRQDEALAYLFQRGIAEWDGVTEYWANKSVVLHAGNLYISSTNNTDRDPTLFPADWVQITGTDPLDTLRGAVVYFAANTAPAGFLKANGAAVSRTTYAALFDRIGTTFGSGNGTTTFNLPDARGEFIRGWDDGRGVDTGRVFGSSQAAELAGHTHTGTTNSAGAHTHQIFREDNLGAGAGVDTADYYAVGPEVAGTTSSDGAHTHSFTTNSTGGTETRPRNLALLACIKY